MAKILVMGDFVPIGSAHAALSRGDANWFSSALEPNWSNADFRVVNLECPLIQGPTPSAKLGPTLGAVAETATALREFSLVGLANNHIMDHGAPGFMHTSQLLEHQEIDHFGAGEDISQAGQPKIINIDGTSIGFIAWSHHEFCIATECSPGAFPIDLIDGLPIIEKLREQCDFIVLLYHGGPEQFPYPTPDQRRLCHFLARRGVDVIICQHSHIVGAQEKVGDSIVVYGQGNFCFDYPAKQVFPHWTEGILCELTLQAGSAPNINSIPMVHSLDHESGPSIADDHVAARILSELAARSDVLSDPQKYDEVWCKWATARASEFLERQTPIGRLGRKLLRMVGGSKILNTQQRMLWHLNHIQCEAHANSIVAGLKKLTNDHNA